MRTRLTDDCVIAKSNTTGSVPGTPMAIGLLPNEGALVPQAAKLTMALVKHSPTMPCSAALSA